jgi:hypothetical protein
LRVRAHLRRERQALGRSAAAGYPDGGRVEGTPLLAVPGWLPAAPLPLEAVRLEWHADAGTGMVNGREPEAAAVLPRRPDGTRYPCYSAALAALDPPAVFTDRPAYRLLDADLGGPHGRLAFGRGRYFAGVDVGEACAHAFAAGALSRSGRPPGDPPPRGLRELVGDPRELRRRPAVLAVSTLTLRVADSGTRATFLAHRRDPRLVAHAGGLYQVLPVGVFQPAGEGAVHEAADFDLWRCMVREFAEELLGVPEQDSAVLDHAAWPLAAELTRARKEGRVRVYCLGLGVDPLTFATDLLTVASVEAATFDALFGGGPGHNAEGRVVRDVPVTARAVHRFVHELPVQPAGAALLALAWRHRATLLNAPA